MISWRANKLAGQKLVAWGRWQVELVHEYHTLTKIFVERLFSPFSHRQSTRLFLTSDREDGCPACNSAWICTDQYWIRNHLETLSNISRCSDGRKAFREDQDCISGLSIMVESNVLAISHKDLAKSQARGSASKKEQEEYLAICFPLVWTTYRGKWWTDASLAREMRSARMIRIFYLLLRAMYDLGSGRHRTN